MREKLANSHWVIKFAAVPFFFCGLILAIFNIVIKPCIFSGISLNHPGHWPIRRDKMKSLILSIVNFPGVKHLIAGAAAAFTLFAVIGFFILGLPILVSAGTIAYDAISVFVDYILIGRLNIQPLLTSDGLKIFADLSKDWQAGMGRDILRYYLIFTTVGTLASILVSLDKSGSEIADTIQQDLNEILG